MAGTSPAQALRDLLRRGTTGLRGLDDLRRQARRQARELRERGRLDGTLEEVRALLDKAVGEERAALFPDPSDDARLREARLDSLPSDVRARRARARRLRLAQPAGARDVRAAAGPAAARGARPAVPRAEAGAGEPATRRRCSGSRTCSPTSTRCSTRTRAASTPRPTSTRSWTSTATCSPTSRRTSRSWSTRSPAAPRPPSGMMNSLTPQQRAELGDLMDQALADLDLASEMGRLSDQLRARRPDLDWDGRRRMNGDEGLGLGDATTALEELADLEQLEETLGPGLPGRRPGRRRRGGGAPRARPGRRRRPRTAAPGRARAGAAGLPDPDRRPAGADREGGASARAYGPASGLRLAAGRAPRRPRRARRRRGRRADRRVTRMAVRRRAAAGRRAHGGQRAAPHRPGRTGPVAGTPAGRRLRGARDRAPYVGRGLPARRPVVLDGAQRHVGRSEADRARAAHADRDAVPAGRAAGHRVLQLRAAAAPARGRDCSTRTWCRAPTCSTR